MAIEKWINGKEEIQEIDLCIFENLVFDKNGILNYCPTMLEQVAMLRKQNSIAISHLL